MQKSLHISTLTRTVILAALIALCYMSPLVASISSYSVVHLVAENGSGSLDGAMMAKDGTVTGYTGSGGTQVVRASGSSYIDNQYVVLPFGQQGEAFGVDGLYKINLKEEITSFALPPANGVITLNGQNRTGTTVGKINGVIGTHFPQAAVVRDPVSGLRVIDEVAGVLVYNFQRINDNGYILGSGISKNGGGDLYLFSPNGGATPMGVGDSYSIAGAINNAAQVVGTTSNFRAFLWENGQKTYPAKLLIPDPAHPGVFNDAVGDSFANDISEDGTVVGAAEFRNIPGFPSNTPAKAWMWTKNGGLVWLDDLIDPTLGFQITSITTIADDGSLLARGLINGGAYHDYQNFLLRPIPEPSTCTLLLGSLLFIRRRRKLCS